MYFLIKKAAAFKVVGKSVNQKNPALPSAPTPLNASASLWGVWDQATCLVTSFSVFTMQIGWVLEKLRSFPYRSALWVSPRLPLTGDSSHLTDGHWPSGKQLVVLPEPWATGHLITGPTITARSEWSSYMASVKDERGIGVGVAGSPCQHPPHWLVRITFLKTEEIWDLTG